MPAERQFEGCKTQLSVLSYSTLFGWIPCFREREMNPNRMLTYINTLRLTEGMSDEQREKVVTILFGGPGEPAKFLDESVKDEIALILFETWLEAERFPTESKGDLVALHKNKGQDNICTEIITLPNGSIVIQVQHLAAYDLKWLSLLNHSFIKWDSQKKMWVIENFLGLFKAAAAKESLNAGNGYEQVFVDVLNVPANKTKSFGRLDNAVAEARKNARRGLVLTRPEDIETTQFAKEAFNGVPDEISLEPDEDELLESAQKAVKVSMPGIYELMQKAGAEEVILH